jgi:integrase
MRLTDRTVATITVPPGKAEIIVFDDLLPGFGIRVRAGGSRRWVYQYRIGSTNRRFTFKEMDAGKARRAAETLAAKVTLGTDPALEKAAAHHAAGDTFKRCLDQYLARPQGKRRNSTLREIRRHLERNLAPLHPLHIKNLDRRRVSVELARLTSECGPVQSNRIRASLSRFLNWCIGEGFADANVALLTNKNEEFKRERVLDDRELRTVWNALPQGDFGDITRLLILTGQRREEIGQLRWSEFHVNEKVIKLQGSRTKNHRPHIIPLSDPALAILKARQQNGRDLVFGRGVGGFSSWTRYKRALNARAPLDQPWVVHDLRRACAIGLANLGVQPHLVETILNHVSGFRAGVAGRYNLAAYESEKRAALDLWGEHVMAVVGAKP